MMELQEISDRLEIDDMLNRYAFAIDERDWDALDAVFTPDAHIDYSAAGGAVGPYSQIKGWLEQALERFPAFQHMVATKKLHIDGDSATCRTILFNPMVYAGDDGASAPQVFFIGLWYRDKMVRTQDGWRISERVEEMSWAHNTPDMPAAQDLEAVNP